MKKIAAVIPIVLFLLSFVVAESLQPEEVVVVLINAAHNNNLQGVLDTADIVKIAQHKRHAHTPEMLVEFLKKIDPKKI